MKYGLRYAFICAVTFFFFAAVLIAASGCGSLLPKGSHSVISPWNNYLEIKAAFDNITISKTTTTELKALGFDPLNTPNIRIMTHIDIMQRFLVNPSIKKEDLDEGIQNCIKARAMCTAYEVDLQQTRYQRYGNVITDLFTFTRKTRMSGWKFNAIIVIVNDVVVYKISGGTPHIDVDDSKKKPLGPLQNIGDVPILVPY
ncbi:MAG: hypothetical protein HQL10_04960 [Nitrospirae bacterium]|nr:hypothetical protein [Nitrospirota bacterium]